MLPVNATRPSRWPSKTCVRSNLVVNPKAAKSFSFISRDREEVMSFARDYFNKVISYGQDRIKGMCLNDNMPTVMAYANDISYESVFVEQLKNFIEPDCLVIALSGSGNSKNVLQAVEFANYHGAQTLGLVGYDGGQLKKLACHSIWIRINDMQVTEDLHLSFGHMTMQKIAGMGCQIQP